MFFNRVLYFMLAALFVALPVTDTSAQELGELRETSANLNVREARNPGAEHVRTLMKGDRVRVAHPKDGWVAVFEPDATDFPEAAAIGYANAKYLDKVPDPRKTSADKGKAQASAEVEPAEGAGQVVSDIQDVPPKPQGPTGVPVKVNADRMTYDEQGKVVAFEGNVVAKHEGLTLTADKVSAFFVTGDKRFDVKGIDRIVATGNVHAEKGNTSGDCGKLTYLVEPRILVMEQEPVLRDGPNSITGEKIRFYVRENRSEVVGGKGKRVEAEFFTNSGLEIQ